MIECAGIGMVTTTGRCFVCGFNIEGQLGLGEDDSRNVPTELKYPRYQAHQKHIAEANHLRRQIEDSKMPGNHRGIDRKSMTGSGECFDSGDHMLRRHNSR